MFKKVIALWLVVLLISVSIAAHAEEKSLKRKVSERFIVQIDSSSSVGGSLKVSSDGKRVAYAAIVGDKSFVVVDGKEEKKYDFSGGGLIFSPDSKRLAYKAEVGDKWFVVVDGKDKEKYDGIVTMINFDKMIGKYQGHEKLTEKIVANRFAYLYYFVAYDRQPVAFIFQYYKPKDKWMIASFDADSKIAEEIEKSAKKDILSGSK